MHYKKGKFVGRIKIVEMESAVHRFKKRSVKGTESSEKGRQKEQELA